MKNKFFLLSTIISSCVLTIACNQSTADEPSPNMPSHTPISPKRPCYPSTKCTGDPNLIGGNRNNGNYNNGHHSNPGSGYSNGSGQQAQQLMTESTEKFSGTVKTINRVKLPNQTQIQLVVTTDQGDILVIVGPANFVDQSKIKFKTGDKIVITGYRINANGNDVIMAARIQRNGSTLELLNDKRQPLWGNQYGLQRPGSQYQPSYQYQNGQQPLWNQYQYGQQFGWSSRPY